MGQVYYCNCKSNERCNKSNCVQNGGTCSLTTEIKYALKNEKGRALICYDGFVRDISNKKGIKQ